MKRLLTLTVLLVCVLYSQTANAVDVIEVEDTNIADIKYVETPKAEADWLVYITKRASESSAGRVVWYYAPTGCGARLISSVPKAQADVKVYFVKHKSMARCKRKCGNPDHT
tara:strand:+ start:4647 stop:4982 length:336 start_codon:yes stop_codon:yes gene_type:complete